jgi:hypothetical protein
MASREFIAKLWRWFDNSFLLWATGLLLVLIPLYPKIPLGELIPGYIVRLRLEDLVIAAIFSWWLLQLLRRKVEWRTPLSLSILAYLAVGLMSNILGVVLTKTIPVVPLHIGKSMFHWFRHIEYFSLFFIAYNAVKTKKQGFVLMMVSMFTLLGVAVYGYGQKYLYWPVYSTMNREFSKGLRLYLTEFARVQSTFAGHYDLGAYLVIILPLMLALYFGLGRGELWREWFGPRVQKILRGLLLASWLSGLWLLAVSASRASFLAYVLGLGVVILLFTLRRSWRWGLTRGFSTLLVSLLIILVVGELPSRFAQLIDQNEHPQIFAAYHTFNDYVKHPGKLVGIQYGAKAPEGGVSLEDYEKQLAQVGLTRSDTQPRPQDVFGNVPEKIFELGDPEASLAGNLVQQGDKLIQERTYSDCALERSLSLCIRFETLWPRAIRGFLSDPLFGSGYATLTKESVEQFTEAESTDNNFLRTLGENGALGFFFYYGAIGLSLWYAFHAYRKTRDPWLSALAIGVIGGGLGLLLNATYLDVFVASKVAYVFWLVQGIALAVFVREGVAAQQFAFWKVRQNQEVSELSRLLALAEKKQLAKAPGQTYLSVKKRRIRSSQAKRSVRRG